MIKVIENQQFNGLEVYFDNKPQQTIIDSLKDLMFKWHGVKKCWFAKKTVERENFVKSLGVSGIETAAEKTECNAKTKKEFELKYQANGIKDKNNKYYSGWYFFDVVSLNIGFHHSSYSDLPCPSGAEYKDDSDSQSDYFCKPSISLSPLCPDFLGILEGYNKQQAHDKKVSDRRGTTRPTDFDGLYNDYYKQYKRTCKTEEELKKLAADFANRDIESIKKYDEALKLAEQLATENNKEKIINIIAERTQAEKERQHNINCESNLRMAENWLKNGGSICGGKAEKIGHYAILKDDKIYQILFENKKQFVFDLIAIDLNTGERHELSGEYESEIARQKAINELKGA